MKLKLLFLFGILLLMISFISSTTSNSFSATTTQFTNPSASAPSFAYSSLISGITGVQGESDNDLYDMQLFIPPLGCKPYVVRSDLLEEQNVPVFCEVMALKINPGVDISRIDRVVTRQQGSNPYISGIGFYPARAAIRASSSSSSMPVDNTVGYVVVVLKKQDTEKSMPDFVNATLSAYIQYGAANSFGLGQTEYYLPVMTDSEFANSYRDYGFFNGMGYLKLDEIDANAGLISIYNSDGTSASDLRRVWSQRIEKGKTSNDFTLSTLTGGQRLKVSLEDVTIPQTKAKILVNGQTFEVYKNGRFYNNKCTLNDVVATGGGSGNVRISCSGSANNFNLVKKFNQVSLLIRGKPEAHSMGDNLVLFNISEPNKQINFYVGYVGSNPTSKKSYIFLAKSSSDNLLDATQAGEISKSIDRSLTGKYLTNPASLKTAGGYDLVYIEEGTNNPVYDVTLTKTIAFNRPGNSSSETYYSAAISSYEDVETKFGNQQSLYAPENTNQTYGADSLWREYNLAVKLGLLDDASKVLSRIFNQYPNSLNKVIPDGDQRSAASIMSENTLLSSEGSSSYDEKSDISIELLLVKEPTRDEASVTVSYTLPKDSKGDRRSETNYDLREKQIISSSDNSFKLTLDSFSENGAYFSYECNKSSVKTAPVMKPGELKVFSDCDFRLQVNSVNLRRVAKVQLTPYTEGKSRESNFSFSVGIEKRAFSMDLTPAEANKKVEELNKKIAELKNITESLGEIIKAGKLACLATNAYLNVKVAFSGSSASARTEVMTRAGGWNDICKGLAVSEPSTYHDMDDCIKKKSKTIESDIVAMTKIMEDYNTQVKTTEKLSIDSTSKQPNDALALANSVQDLQNSAGITMYDGNNVITDINGKSAEAIIASMNTSLGDIGWTDSRELWVNIQLSQSGSVSPELKKSAQSKIYSVLKTANDKVGDRDKETALKNSNGLPISFAINEKLPKANYQNLVWNQQFWSTYKVQENSADFQKFIDRLAFISSKDRTQTYLINLAGSGDTLTNGGKIYLVTGTVSTGLTLTKYDDSSQTDPNKKPEQGINFLVLDETSYKNPCTNCNYMEVFSLEPNKGQPALLPFDKNEGWYIYVVGAVGGFGNKASYQASGAVNSMYICNVGKNGVMESMGNDDLCQMFNTYTGQSSSIYSGLSADKAKTLITNAQRAMLSAQQQLAANPSAKSIAVNGITLEVRSSEGTSGGKCTDFMSSSDCALMFNVCDPFVCPTSRCDFGGKYRVDNVIASGLVGSIALCLPNSVLAGGDVYVPVCITGISAGIEGLTSILESYRDCVNESAATNKTVGICDQVYSVYACDFWWKNVGPFASAIAKNIFSGDILFGKGNRGGGEYMFTENAWNNAEKSWQLFSQQYASESKLAFGGKSFTEIGSDLCKSRLSATYPNFDSILAPESPVQLYASFDEMPYTDATVPPSSQYKVYYHIYAGNDSGASYQVYLTDGVTYPGYISKSTSVVATGYVNQAGYKSETKDYIDVSGFKKLCVRVNAKDYCGFKQVSTDFGLNYLKDKAVKNQATANDITSESECVSGSSSIMNAATSMGNLQSAAQSTLNPQIYNYGIVRVCSTNNPGLPASASRWTPVGTCGQDNIKCWVDGNSVKDALIFTGNENKTAAELEKINTDALLQQGYLGEVAGKDNITALENKYKPITDSSYFNTKLSASDFALLGSLNNDVQTLYDKLILGTQKGQLLYIKSNIYYAAAKRAAMTSTGAVPPVTAPAAPTATAPLTASAPIVNVKFVDDISSVDYTYNRAQNYWEYKGWFSYARVTEMGFPYSNSNQEIAKQLAAKNELEGLDFLTAVSKQIGVTVTGLPVIQTSAVTADDTATVLAKMIYGEEEDQNLEAKKAVAWVAVNRVNAGNFGGSNLIAVITSTSPVAQFQGYHQRGINLDPASLTDSSKKTAWANSLIVANTIIATQSNVPAEYQGYLYFGNGPSVKSKMDSCNLNPYNVPGSTLYLTKKDYSVCTPVPTSTPAVPTSTGTVSYPHTVAKGETVSSISMFWSMSSTELKAANPSISLFTDEQEIPVGTILQIPVK